MQPGYPGPPQGAYLGPQAGYPIPPPNYTGAGPVGFPVQNQPGGPILSSSSFCLVFFYWSGSLLNIFSLFPELPGISSQIALAGYDNILGRVHILNTMMIMISSFVFLVLTGFETNNKYEIKNSLGQRVYFAVEENDCCTRNCFGSARPFTLKVLDNLGREVITLHRPLACSSCCCPCCLQEFTIQNEKREDVLKITGPCVVCSCCSDVDFEIKSLDEESLVGKISKHWTGFLREAFTDADNFGIQFPLDLDVKMKAVMLGACFLIVSVFLLILVTEAGPSAWQKGKVGCHLLGGELALGRR
uniref:Phospholipid scramblase n=1 Tax=Marmota marmota marmota TaxID=9994 RepID=A0A8C5ZRA4_MARMA